MNLDTLLPVGLLALVLAGGWIVAGTFRHTNSRAERLTSWLAYSIVVFLIGGGLAMFGVVLLLFFVGREAAQAGLALAVALLVLSPVIVGVVMYARQRGVRLS
jgi:hypothetical protein